ncbi:MAG: oligosaccharide flippase family protein [Clostridia bacterium]|nr:oligosaccharide flippase family protein [Clostridia bacterium]
MDKKKSFLNVFFAIFFRLILIVLAIISRRYLIGYVSNDANGLFSLYTSIVGILAIAELGVGTAISFSMYRPIAEGDKVKVAALYNLFIKVYRIIGLIILVVGLAIMPLLPYLAKNYTISSNLYLTYVIVLVSVVLTYLFSAKTSLINAYKNNYITTTINSLAQIVQYSLQIVILLVFKSFEWFLACLVLSSILQFIMTEIVTRKKYKDIISMKEKIDVPTKKEVVKLTKAMFAHKLGAVLVNTIDSVIISAFIGVAVLGKYTNYTTIAVAMNSTLALFFTPLTSIIGIMCVKESKENIEKYLNFFYSFNFIIGSLFYLGYLSVIDELIQICFGGADLLMARDVSIVITVNYFIQFMRNTVLLFRDATGTFYNDRYKPIIEGVINIGLSILLVHYIGVVGVIVATIFTNIVICHVIEPYVLYKNVLNKKPTSYYFKNYILIGFFVGLVFLVNYLYKPLDNVWISALRNGGIAVALSAPTFILLFCFDKSFRFYFIKLFKKLINKLRHKESPPIVENQDNKIVEQPCDTSIDSESSNNTQNIEQNNNDNITE